MLPWGHPVVSSGRPCWIYVLGVGEGSFIGQKSIPLIKYYAENREKLVKNKYIFSVINVIYKSMTIRVFVRNIFVATVLLQSRAFR